MAPMELYEPPTLTVVGTVDELTEAGLVGGIPDGVFTHLRTPRVSPINDE